MKNWNERFEKQFKNIRISLPEFDPGVSSHLEYLYSDYVELITLFSNRLYVTKQDVLQRLGKEDGAERDLIISEVDELGELENLFDSENTAERNDIKERWIDKVFRVVEDRIILYKNAYPCELDPHRGL